MKNWTKIYKDDVEMMVKPDRLQRFLAQGWQLSAQPVPKNPAVFPDVKVEAAAEVIEAEVEEEIDDWEDTVEDDFEDEAK